MNLAEKQSRRFPTFSYRGWFESVPLKVKLTVGFGAIILMLLAVVISAYTGITEVERSERDMYDQNLVNVVDLPALRANLNAERLDIAMLLEGNRLEWGTWLEDLNRRSERDYRIINRLILRLRTDPYESRRLGEFIDLRDAYQKERDEQIRQIQSARMKKKARDSFLGIQELRYQKMRAILHELENKEVSEARQMLLNAEETTQARIRMFVSFGIGTILLSILLAGFMSRSVSSHIYRMKLEETALARANRSLRMINICNEVIVRATNETQLLAEVCKSIVETGKYRLAWIGYAQNDEHKSVKPMAFAGDDEDYVYRAEISWGEDERGRGPTGVVIRTGNPIIVKDTRTEPGFEPWRYHALEKGLLSSATFPLKDGDAVYGALMVYSDKVDAFDEEETRLLQEFASVMAYAGTALRARATRSEAEKCTKGPLVYVRDLFGVTSYPLVAVALDGKIADVNAAAENVTGRSRSDMVGSDFSANFTEPERAAALLRDALLSGFVRDWRLAVQPTTGFRRDLLCSAAVYRNGNGAVDGVLVETHDSVAMKEAATKK